MTTEILEHAKELKRQIDNLKSGLALFNGSSTRYKNVHFGIVGIPDDVSSNHSSDILMEIRNQDTIDKIKDAIEERIDELEEEFARL